VIGREGNVNVVVTQEFARDARVLSGDEVNLLENAQQPQADVFEVANRCAANKKNTCHLTTDP